MSNILFILLHHEDILKQFPNKLYLNDVRGGIRPTDFEELNFVEKMIIP